MTIMVKTNIGTQKQGGDVTVVPLVDFDEAVPVVNTAPKVNSSKSTRVFDPFWPFPFKYLMLTGVLLLGLGILLGMVVFTEKLDRYTKSHPLNYRGTCAISTTDDADYVVVVPAGEMRVYSAGSALIAARALSGLLERVAVEGARESVAVQAGARGYSIVHDFADNYTNIMSPERCFVMEMVRQFVLEPAALVASFHDESALQLAHAHSVYRAQLPSARAAPAPAPALPCVADGRPVYRLTLEGTHVLRKRSVDRRRTTALPTTAPPTDGDLANNDFVHFSGNHLQRITISNLDDVVRYEHDNNALQSHPKMAAAAADDE